MALSYNRALPLANLLWESYPERVAKAPRGPSEFCGMAIAQGQRYRDGGARRRAHANWAKK